MPGGVTAEAPRRVARRDGIAETPLERRGAKLDAGAPVTAAVAVGDAVATGFGDGAVRFFRPGLAPVVVRAHRGAVLCVAADAGHVLTGGDDGRFLRVSPEGAVEEIASFGTRWVDCVAAGPGWRACSSGRVAHVWRAGEPAATPLEHPSTVGGLAFDSKGGRLAVAHYGGATLWERRERRWKPSTLAWKGSHGAVAFSPDGRFLVSAMQENALHGWRLRDKADMRMSGYPAKVKSFAWLGTAPFLATSGADEAICWPFDGKDGPMERGPLACAWGGRQLCTAVAGVLGLDGVFAGFQDGAVLAGMLVDRGADKAIKGSSGAPVTALAVTLDGWLFVGDAAGATLWARLGGA
ncbi:MAG: WD40 repeat domain-containing protein [Rubrimonas sp.]